jgi:porphobilinogen synthase
MLSSANLIANVIVIDDGVSPPGRFLPYVRLGELSDYIDQLSDADITRCKLFVRTPLEKKGRRGAEGLREDNVMLRAISTIREASPNMDVLTEVCACSYSDSGECALLDSSDRIDDPKTHDYVGKMAVLHADSGATTAVAGLTHPGSVAAMRQALDRAGHHKVEVMASVQMASKFYGPYRNLMRTEPESGNTHRSHTAVENPKRALRMAQSFLDEGASQLTIQPIMVAVDILYQLRQAYPEVPLSAYSVSTELCLGSSGQSWLAKGREAIVFEYYSYLLRAGADTVMSYIAPEMGRWIRQSRADMAATV